MIIEYSYSTQSPAYSAGGDLDQDNKGGKNSAFISAHCYDKELASTFFARRWPHMCGH